MVTLSAFGIACGAPHNEDGQTIEIVPTARDGDYVGEDQGQILHYENQHR